MHTAERDQFAVLRHLMGQFSDIQSFAHIIPLECVQAKRASYRYTDTIADTMPAGLSNCLSPPREESYIRSGTYSGTGFFVTTMAVLMVAVMMSPKASVANKLCKHQ